MSENISGQITRSVVWNFLGEGWMLVITFFATPFIVHRLNVNLYGIYTLVGVIIGYFSFLQFGLGTASVKYISEYLAQKQEEKIRQVFWSCLLVYILLGTVGTALIALLTQPLVARFFVIPSELKPTAVLVLRIGALGFLLSMLLGVVSSGVRSLGRFDVVNRINITVGTLQIAVTVVLLLLGYSLKEIVIAGLVIQVLGIGLYWSATRRLLPFLMQPSWDRKSLGQLFRFGGFVTISGVLGPILTNIEKIFLTSLRSVASLTYYSVPYALTSRMSLIPSAFSSVAFPAFSYFQGAGKEAMNKNLYNRITSYIFFLCVFLVLFFMAFGNDFLGAWMGSDFVQKSGRILIILASAALINALAWPALAFLHGVGKPNLPAFFHIGETILYIPLCYFLISRYAGVGAALAWFLRVLIDTLLLQKAICSIFGEGLMFWYLRFFYRVGGPLVIGSLLFWGLRNLHLAFLSFFNLAGILLIFVMYVYVVWGWGLDTLGRKGILEFLTKIGR